MSWAMLSPIVGKYQRAKPLLPSQWIEEALVEDVYAKRGLGRLAESWKTNPPFPGDNHFGEGISEVPAEYQAALQ